MTFSCLPCCGVSGNQGGGGSVLQHISLLPGRHCNNFLFGRRSYRQLRHKLVTHFQHSPHLGLRSGGQRTLLALQPPIAFYFPSGVAIFPSVLLYAPSGIIIFYYFLLCFPSGLTISHYLLVYVGLRSVYGRFTLGLLPLFIGLRQNQLKYLN